MLLPFSYINPCFVLFCCSLCPLWCCNHQAGKELSCFCCVLGVMGLFSSLLRCVCSTSYGVYTSQLIHFARASSYVADFNTRNKLLTQKLLKQGYRYHKLRKTFSKFNRRYMYFDLISKFQV